MPATPAPRRLHRLVVARRNPPCRGLSLGLGIERPTPAGLLARGSGLDARLPRLSQWLSGSKSGRSEEHTSELQSLMRISYAVFCLKKKKRIQKEAHGNHLQTPLPHGQRGG